MACSGQRGPRAHAESERLDAPALALFAGTMIAPGFRALIEVRTAEATETHTSGVGASCSARDLE